MSPASLPLAATLIVDPPLPTTGQCGEGRFPGPPPAPSCAFTKNGNEPARHVIGTDVAW